MADIKRVYRYEVPIDDAVHMIPDGKVIHVDTRRVTEVEVWIEFPATGGLPDLPVQAFGTGHDIPADAVHLGTALTPDWTHQGGQPRGRFVWHLYAVAGPF